MAPRPVAALHWFRLRRAHLRDRLVSAPAAVGRFLRGLAGHPPWHLHGGNVPRQPAVAARDRPGAPSAAGLRLSGTRHRRVRSPRAVRCAPDRLVVHDHRGYGTDESVPAGDRRRHLSAAADDPDGRDASGDRPVGRSHAIGRVMARILLRRQSRRRGRWMPSGRLLPAAAVRHADGHLRRGRAQRRRRASRSGDRARHHVHAEGVSTLLTSPPFPRLGSSTSRSRCPE